MRIGNIIGGAEDMRLKNMLFLSIGKSLSPIVRAWKNFI